MSEATPCLPERFSHDGEVKVQGLTVQGVSRVRLTPYPNQSVSVPDEVKTVLAVRNLARQFTENKTAIVAAGRGLPPAALTVRAHVRLLIIGAGLARLAASTKQRESIETAEPRSDTKVDVSGYNEHVSNDKYMGLEIEL